MSGERAEFVGPTIGVGVGHSSVAAIVALFDYRCVSGVEPAPIRPILKRQKEPVVGHRPITSTTPTPSRLTRLRQTPGPKKTVRTSSCLAPPGTNHKRYLVENAGDRSVWFESEEALKAVSANFGLNHFETFEILFGGVSGLRGPAKPDPMVLLKGHQRRHPDPRTRWNPDRLPGLEQILRLGLSFALHEGGNRLPAGVC